MKTIAHKQSPTLLACFITIMHMIGCSGSANTITTATDSTMRSAILENNWVFTANYVIPQGGRSRPTNDLYTVTLQGTRLTASLPYFGRAFGGAVLTNQSPLAFVSNDFEKLSENVKGGKWSVTLKPKDYAEVQTLTFTFFESGSASLNVTLTNRSAISFNGNIRPLSIKPG